jgi:hypothetical protein
MFVLVKEVAIFSIIALALMDTQDINVNSHNVMGSIQPIQTFAPQKDLAIF